MFLSPRGIIIVPLPSSLPPFLPSSLPVPPDRHHGFDCPDSLHRRSPFLLNISGSSSSSSSSSCSTTSSRSTSSIRREQQHRGRKRKRELLKKEARYRCCRDEFEFHASVLCVPFYFMHTPHTGSSGWGNDQRSHW